MKKVFLLLSFFYFGANAQSFGPGSVNWTTPTGGFYAPDGTNRGFFMWFCTGPSYDNGETWSLIDMNGDTMPDLVIPSYYQSINGSEKQFGVGSAPYWKVHLNNGSGFSPSAITWSTPVGGFYNSASVNYGYFSLIHLAPSYDNSQVWTLKDMNGDAKPDLVVYSEYQSGNGGVMQFGTGSSPYWKVYLNTGSGFSSAFINWQTPAGGYYNSSGVNFGYFRHELSVSADDNSQNWSMEDINGDALPDLIVPSEYQTLNNGAKQYGVGMAPYWKVYLNTGIGFSSTITTWSTPVGGYYNNSGTNYGYNDLNFAVASSANSQNWNLKDIDGDSKPDLVVPSEYQSTSNAAIQYGTGSTPHWKVYLNNGNGFSAAVTTWSTPTGGFFSSTGVHYGYNALSAYGYHNLNSQNWIVQDLNGDAKPELIVSADCQNVSTGQMQFGAGSSPYWKVYMNTGTGYSNSILSWTTPLGGYVNMSGVNLGYFLTSSYGSSFDGSENWTLMDMNGDRIDDLVIPSEYESVYNGQMQYGVGSTPYWIVYINSGFVGLEDQPEANPLSVYPNPVESILYVDTREEGDLTIYNVTGESVFQQRWTRVDQSLDLSFLSTGVYVMKLVTKQEIRTARIIK